MFASFSNPLGDDCEFLLRLPRHFDIALLWYALAGNEDVERMARVLFGPRRG